MMEHHGALSLLPPLLAIILAIATRQVFLSLTVGIWFGYLVVRDWSVLAATTATIDGCVNVFADAGNTRVILFSMLVGSLIALMQRSGGVSGFVNLVHDSGAVQGRRSAGILSVLVGMVVFIESSISCLVTGAVARPIFDRLKLSREKLAYVCDTSSAPTCLMIPLNGWGAFVLAQLAGLGVADPVALLVSSLPYHFYAILSLLILFVTVGLNFDFGPMRKAQRRAADEGKVHADTAQPMVSDDVIAMETKPGATPKAVNMILPVVMMVAMVPVGLWYTGVTGLGADAPATFWNVVRAASGSTAVLWAVLVGVFVAAILAGGQRILGLREIVDVSFKGAGGLAPLGALMMLAFAIGWLCKNELGTGAYVASLVPHDMPAVIIVPTLFVLAAAIAFSTGTSWGTFAIMLPIALPVAEKLGISPAIAVSAVLSGGVFGDHCSPISDTTIVSSMASACDHIDHVRTQLPYALVAGLGAVILYAVAASLM